MTRDEFMKELAYLLRTSRMKTRTMRSNTIQITMKRPVLIRKQRSSRN